MTRKVKLMDNFISIDIGGTAIKYGIISGDGRILEKHDMKTEAWLGGPSIVAKVIDIVQGYKDAFSPAGICISTAGMVNTKTGEIFHAAPLIPNYTGTNYKTVLEQRFLIPCEVENDVNCAGLAESISGAAVGASVALCLTVGTGIGGAVIMDGRVFHGAGYSACEVGYMTLSDSDFQTLGASSILTKNVAEMKQEPVSSWNGYRIFREARGGDADCIRAIDAMVQVLGEGIANICYVLNPDVVVLGGGIMAQEDYLRGRIESALSQRLVPAVAKSLRLEFAKYKNDAGMMGAYYHFRQQHPQI